MQKQNGHQREPKIFSENIREKNKKTEKRKKTHTIKLAGVLRGKAVRLGVENGRGEEEPLPVPVTVTTIFA